MSFYITLKKNSLNPLSIKEYSDSQNTVIVLVFGVVLTFAEI